MRQRQSRILRNMAQQINTCHLAASESLILAQLFSKIAAQLSQINPAHDLLDDIERYLQVFRNRSLPKTREEFETRATLLQLLREAETFIQVKVDFYQKYMETRTQRTSENSSEVLFFCIWKVSLFNHCPWNHQNRDIFCRT